MIKGIIFDYGGVLTIKGTFIDFAKDYAKKFHVDYKELLKVMEDIEESVKINKINSKFFWKTVSEYLNYDEDKFRTELIEYFEFREDTLQLVESLKGKYKLALLSNQIEDWLEQEIKKHKLNEVFDVIVASYKVKLAKPDPKIYQITLDRLELKPEECIFIDDLERNIKPAKELGIKTILFKNLEQLKRDLKKFGILEES